MTATAPFSVRFADDSPLDAPADLLVLGVAKDPSGDVAALDARLGGGLLAHLAARKFQPGAGEALVLPTFGRLPAGQVALVGIGDRTPADLRAAAAKAGALALEHKATRLALHLGSLAGRAAGAVLEAVAIGSYTFDRYLPADKRRPALAEVGLYDTDAGPARDAAVRRGLVAAAWQRECRDLVNLPAAELFPATLADAARALSALAHVQVEVIDIETCKARGYVGIVAVGQGSARPGCLIRISYRPPGARETVALVGKGVTFDSGGLSIKPSDAMQTMRCDMGGAASVIAAMGAIAELGLPVNVEAFAPCVENMINGDSYKLGDILTYNNGVSVEIHNTDAEGRLILADALILASEVPGVSRIVDLATLTGAVIIALGPDYTGLFTADDALAAELQTSFDRAGELAWRLPLFSGYNRLFKGTWGQIKNVGGREGGSITAALFLQHFVKKDVRWAHLDIAGAAFADRPVEPYTAGGTGQPVRTLIDWVSSLG